MRILYLLILFNLQFLKGYSLDKLSSDYLIAFGNPDSPIKIVQYFSFTCPHCLTLYRKDFHEVKTKYLETVSWVFHPVPMDLLTVQAMDCLEKLSAREKRLFLESLLDVIPLDGSALSVLYMQKAMELFEKPIKELQKKEYLSNTKAFQDAFLFIKQKDKINAVPSVEINDLLYANEIPDIAFIDKKVQELLQAEKNSKKEGE
ncbi:MAG: thioredoxin domain-containing protein [Chlamydiales bacterium]